MNINSFYKMWLRSKIKPIVKGNPPQRVNTVWVIFTQLLGDSILISPVPGLVKEKWPQAQLTVVADARNNDVWKYNPYVDRIVEVHGLKRRGIHGLAQNYWELSDVACQAKQEGVDLMLCLDHTSYGIYLGMLAQPQWGVGFRSPKIGRDHWSVTFPKPDRNMTGIYQEMAMAAGLDITHWKQMIYWPDEAERQARELLVTPLRQRRILIGVAPWTSMRVKDWRLDQVIAFCDLAHQNGFCVVLLGTGANRNEAEQIVSLADTKPLNLVGKTNIPQLASVIDQLSAVVSCDSGIAHLSATLDKKLVVLFGHVDPEIWKPLSTTMTILKKEVCDHCQKFKCQDPHCMAFTAEEVLDALRSQLEIRINGQSVI